MDPIEQLRRQIQLEEDRKILLMLKLQSLAELDLPLAVYLAILKYGFCVKQQDKAINITTGPHVEWPKEEFRWE